MKIQMQMTMRRASAVVLLLALAACDSLTAPPVGYEDTAGCVLDVDANASIEAGSDVDGQPIAVCADWRDFATFSQATCPFAVYNGNQVRKLRDVNRYSFIRACAWNPGTLGNWYIHQEFVKQ